MVGQALGSQEGSYSLQYFQPLTCSWSRCVYVAGPVELLVSGAKENLLYPVEVYIGYHCAQDAVILVTLWQDGLVTEAVAQHIPVFREEARSMHWLLKSSGVRIRLHRTGPDQTGPPPSSLGR
eukprot:g24924.t1